MATIRALVTVAIVACALESCGVIDGLSQYSKEDCAHGCDDASADTTTGTQSDGADDGTPIGEGDGANPPSGDATDDALTDSTADAIVDATSDATGDGHADAPNDAPVDSMADATGDGQADATSDAPSSEAGGPQDGAANDGSGGATDASDGGSSSGGDGGDGGCGPLTSVDNCGACGVACDKTTGAPQCNGTTCSYTCNAGRSNCNKAAPDTDGCECATPACCGSGCQTTHSDGVGQSFYDCSPVGTYTSSSATAACKAYVAASGGNASACTSDSSCGTPYICSMDALGNCNGYCWQYSAPQAGNVWPCSCLGSLAGTWK